MAYVYNTYTKVPIVKEKYPYTVLLTFCILVQICLRASAPNIYTNTSQF